MCLQYPFDEYIVLFGVFSYGVLIGYTIMKDIQRILKEKEKREDKD